MVMWDQGQGVWQIYLSVALYSQNSSRLQNTLATNLYRETWEKLKKIKEKKQTSNCFETADNGSAFAFASYYNCPFVGIHHILDLPIGMLCPKKVPLLETFTFYKKTYCFFRRTQTKSRVRSSCAPTFVLRYVTFFYEDMLWTYAQKRPALYVNNWFSFSRMNGGERKRRQSYVEGIFVDMDSLKI